MLLPGDVKVKTKKGKSQKGEKSFRKQISKSPLSIDSNRDGKKDICMGLRRIKMRNDAAFRSDAFKESESLVLEKGFRLQKSSLVKRGVHNLYQISDFNLVPR